MNGYFLFGTNDEIILVFKSSSEEEIINIIKKIATMRSREMKALASELEESFYERSNGYNVKAGPKDKTKGSNSTRSRNPKAENSKHRAKHSPKRMTRIRETDPSMGE